MISGTRGSNVVSSVQRFTNHLGQTKTSSVEQGVGDQGHKTKVKDSLYFNTIAFPLQFVDKAFLIYVIVKALEINCALKGGK